jgi:hypothetical protein
MGGICGDFFCSGSDIVTGFSLIGWTCESLQEKSQSKKFNKMKKLKEKDYIAARQTDILSPWQAHTPGGRTHQKISFVMNHTTHRAVPRLSEPDFFFETFAYECPR